MPRVALGMDFGTQSLRVLVADIETGRELAVSEKPYPHGVMDTALPDGTKLLPGWALQHPADYLHCMYAAVPEAIHAAGASPADVVGIGVDCTSCTLLPVAEDGTPMCLREQWASDPHAWIKLWKHHAPQRYADRMTEAALERGEAFLAAYGGKVSSEWLLPKLMETFEEAPELFRASDRFVEAGDWIVWNLCGDWTRSESMAGYKTFWSRERDLLTDAYLDALKPGFAAAFHKAVRGDVLPAGSRAGRLNAEAARKLGLPSGIAVAAANIDAHVSFPATGYASDGVMAIIMGTSACHIVNASRFRIVPGICGAVEDGVIPGWIGYEAGQSGFGDHLAWFLRECVPERYQAEARRNGVDMHSLLADKASALRPGESGLLALDWWNGNRSVLVDADLTGLIVGLTLRTKPEEIYRALIEAMAFGTRRILQAFEEHDIPIHTICACGGIAQKNPMLMQIFADITGREMRMVRSAQAPALGSAMFGAVAAGSAEGGYDTISQAAEAMGGTMDTRYVPDPSATRVYGKLYREYIRLHDLFGRGGVDTMKRLQAIRDTIDD